MQEFLINSGEISITGCQKAFKTNSLYSYISNGKFFVNEKTISGFNKIEGSVNCLSLSEGVFYPSNEGVEDVYSGDFSFINSGYRGIIHNQLLNGDSIYFREKPTSKYAICYYENTGDLKEMALLSISNAGLNSGQYLSNLDCFINGQKLYSGYSFSVVSGDIVFDIDFTGQFFAKEKTNSLNSFINSLEFGFFLPNKSFLENNSVIFSNGVEKDKKTYIELYSGVKCISGSKSCEFYPSFNDSITNFRL